MGQYYVIANLDKRQYLSPHSFGSGLKLMEFSSDGESIMQAVAILLADGNNRGGGDLRTHHPLVGSWAGDRIVVAGDYADDGKFCDGEVGDEGQKLNLHSVARTQYEDISDSVIRVIVEAEGSQSRMSKLNLDKEYRWSIQLDIPD